MEEHGPDTHHAVQIINTWIADGDLEAALKLYCLRLKTLPPIPQTVRRLTIGHVQIRHITTLPPNLISLDIMDTPLITICPIPATVTSLFITFSQLQELPGPLPPNLRTFYCLGSKIKKLPPFPEDLVAISIQKNPNLHEIPSLPTKKLNWINISHTPIRVISVPACISEIYLENCPNLLVERGKNESMESYRARWTEVTNTRRWVPRMRLIKEELVSVMWHPRRVWGWIKAGHLVGYINGEPEHDYSVLDMMTGDD
jgi:hypothetical protein